MGQSVSQERLHKRNNTKAMASLVTASLVTSRQENIIAFATQTLKPPIRAHKSMQISNPRPRINTNQRKPPNRPCNQTCAKTLQLHEDRSFQQARAQNMKVSNANHLRMQIRAFKLSQNNESVYDANNNNYEEETKSTILLQTMLLPESSSTSQMPAEPATEQQ